jgi:hypothetical protein
MLTLTFPIMSLLLFLVVQVEKRQFGGEQGGTMSPPLPVTGHMRPRE